MTEVSERPNMRFERVLWAACALMGFIGIDVLTYLMFKGTVTWHFIGLGLLALFTIYALAMFWFALTLRYVLKGNDLVVQQGALRARLRLNRQVRLVRWRARWGWGDNAERELGVAEIHHYPPVWLSRDRAAWVLIHEGKHGRSVAVVMRPSTDLLERIRSRVQVDEPVAS